MPRGDCGGEGARQPCCRRRGGGGGALVEPAALAALLYAGGSILACVRHDVIAQFSRYILD